jgi:sugar phosphate isomerase/epimerase
MTDRLVASYWTIAGATPNDPARFPFESRVRTAAETGFWGIGMHVDDYLRTRERGASDDEMLRLLESTGMAIHEIEFLTGWSSDVEAIRAHSLQVEAAIFAAVDALGARQLNVGCAEFPGEVAPVERLAERFAALCERAAAHDLTVALEFLPWSGIPDIATAWDVVRQSSAPNGGILLDVWHFFRGNPDFDVLRSVPADRIVGVQVNDGPAEAAGEIREETRHGRRLPGHGDFDLSRMVRELRAMGVSAPWAIEVMSDDLTVKELRAACRLAFDATTAMLESARVDD